MATLDILSTRRPVPCAIHEHFARRYLLRPLRKLSAFNLCDGRYPFASNRDLTNEPGFNFGFSFTTAHTDFFPSSKYERPFGRLRRRAVERRSRRFHRDNARADPTAPIILFSTQRAFNLDRTHAPRTIVRSFQICIHYGRATAGDGTRVVYARYRAMRPVFLFDDRGGVGATITALGARSDRFRLREIGRGFHRFPAPHVAAQARIQMEASSFTLSSPTRKLRASKFFFERGGIEVFHR